MRLLRDTIAFSGQSFSGQLRRMHEAVGWLLSGLEPRLAKIPPGRHFELVRFDFVMEWNPLGVLRPRLMEVPHQ